MGSYYQVRDAGKRTAGQRKAIHALRRKLGLDRDVYESILQRLGGATSSTELSPEALFAVLDELRLKAGEKPRVAYPGKPHNFDSARAMPEMITKVEAQLADMGLPWAYADSITKRMHGIDRVAWCRTEGQLRDVIAALHVEQEKRGLLAALEERRIALGIDDAQWQAMTADLPAGWQRNRQYLRQMGVVLESIEPRPLGHG